MEHMKHDPFTSTEKPSNESIAKTLHCTVDSVREGFAKNAKQLRAMHALAVKKGKKVCNFTAEELDRRATYAEERAGLR
jgi:hypothetical protein